MWRASPVEHHSGPVYVTTPSVTTLRRRSVQVGCDRFSEHAQQLWRIKRFCSAFGDVPSGGVGNPSPIRRLSGNPRVLAEGIRTSRSVQVEAAQRFAFGHPFAEEFAHQ